MKPVSQQKLLPWYFQPLKMTGVWLGMFIFQLVAAVYPPTNLFGIVAIITVGLGALVIFSWPYLLYEYLAVAAPIDSKHKSGRCLPFFLIMLGGMLGGLILDSLGYNTIEPNEAADLVIIPIFIGWLAINWRVSDLLVEL